MAKEPAEITAAFVQEMRSHWGPDLDAVVRATVYLVDMDDFAAVNEVMSRFLDEPYPARACVQVAALPRGAAVEIEAILAL